MDQKILIILLSIAVIVITVAIFKIGRKTKPQSDDTSIPILKTQDNHVIAFQPIDTLSEEEERQLVPILDRQLVQRAVDSIPRISQVGSNAINAANAANLVNGGIYQAIIPKGALLDKSRAMEGAFRGSFRNVPNSIQGNANWIPVDGSVSKIAAVNAANAIMGTASMVVGQYYMSQINSQLEKVNHGISSIKQHLNEDYYSKVMQLVLDVQKISEFKTEIFENEKEKERILNKLSSLESQCERLLIQANKHLSYLSNTVPDDYKSYENFIRDSSIWYQYQQGLTEVLNSISELRYTLNDGVLSKEYVFSGNRALFDQTNAVKNTLESWHKRNGKKFGIDIALEHRNRKGLNALAWKVPGLFNNELNYKRISSDTANTIRQQTTNNNSSVLLDDPYSRDIVLIEKDDGLYYLPIDKKENETKV